MTARNDFENIRAVLRDELTPKRPDPVTDPTGARMFDMKWHCMWVDEHGKGHSEVRPELPISNAALDKLAAHIADREAAIRTEAYDFGVQMASREQPTDGLAMLFEQQEKIGELEQENTKCVREFLESDRQTEFNQLRTLLGDSQKIAFDKIVECRALQKQVAQLEAELSATKVACNTSRKSGYADAQADADFYREYVGDDSISGWLNGQSQPTPPPQPSEPSHRIFPREPGTEIDIWGDTQPKAAPENRDPGSSSDD